MRSTFISNGKGAFFILILKKMIRKISSVTPKMITTQYKPPTKL